MTCEMQKSLSQLPFYSGKNVLPCKLNYRAKIDWFYDPLACDKGAGYTFVLGSGGDEAAGELPKGMIRLDLDL